MIDLHGILGNGRNEQVALRDALRPLMLTVSRQHIQIDILQHVDATVERAHVPGLRIRGISRRCQWIAALDTLHVPADQNACVLIALKIRQCDDDSTTLR